MRVRRIGSAPIIAAGAATGVGDNVNGPSLIRVPDWVRSPLGRYYLYFAHHDGRHVRLAAADAVEGPWRVYEPGVLPLAASGFAGHVASPDVHVDHAARQIRMYFHGSNVPTGQPGPQRTRVALSVDGLDFEARPGDLTMPYLRVVRRDGEWLGLAMPPHLYRSRDGLAAFERGPRLLDGVVRHSALVVEDGRLLVFYTRIGDAPERIVFSHVALDGDWHDWRASEPVDLLAPERAYEGAGEPRVASARGMVRGPANALRDPCVFVDEGRRYLLYAVAGEQGIGLAELV